MFPWEQKQAQRFRQQEDSPIVQMDRKIARDMIKRGF